MRLNKKTIISLVLCIGVCFMAVGYSILMSELKINGSASISSTWDIRVTGITEVSRTGSAYNIEEPSYTVDTAKFNVALVNPGDSISFEVTIENKGTLTAILNSIDITTSGTEAIIYEVTGFAEGDTIVSGETITLAVKATYNSNEIADPYDRVKRLKVGLDWVQYTNQTITPKTYTIAYNSNGGTGSMSNTTCTVGTTCTLTNNAFTRDDYVFLGWSTTVDGPVVYNDQQSVNNLTSGGKKATLYAVWRYIYGYASDNLLVLFDGIDNAGSGSHSNNVTTWTNLVGNGFNGQIYNATWGSNYLSFDGDGDYVAIGQINPSYITLEVVAEVNSNSMNMVIITNNESGGAGFATSSSDSVIKGNVYVDKYYFPPNFSYSLDNKYVISLTYDGSNVSLYANGAFVGATPASGTIKTPDLDTIWAIGVNPSGSTPVSNYLNGKIYSVRMYNRALTEEEVLNNQNIDISRFGI